MDEISNMESAVNSSTREIMLVYYISVALLKYFRMFRQGLAACKAVGAFSFEVFDGVEDEQKISETDRRFVATFFSHARPLLAKLAPHAKPANDSHSSQQQHQRP